MMMLMNDVVSIYEAKSQLSRLVKRAHAGEVIYLGAYGRAEAMLAPVPPRRTVAVGVWKDRRAPDFAYDTEDLIGPDPEVAADFDAAVERDETAR
jgi:antitoxin (DNA-binding transcriptional repressor) of toxin-antitoxin stability system